MFQILSCLSEVGTNFVSSPLGSHLSKMPNRALGVWELGVDLVAPLAWRVLRVLRDACNSPVLLIFADIRDQALSKKRASDLSGVMFVSFLS